MALSSSFPASRRFPRGCTHPLSYNDHTRQKRTVRLAACGVWWFRWWVVFLNQFVKVVLTGVLSDYPACPVVAGWGGVTTCSDGLLVAGVGRVCGWVWALSGCRRGGADPCNATSSRSGARCTAARGARSQIVMIAPRAAPFEPVTNNNEHVLDPSAPQPAEHLDGCLAHGSRSGSAPSAR